jgi:hypothetical protein
MADTNMCPVGQDRTDVLERAWTFLNTANTVGTHSALKRLATYSRERKTYAHVHSKSWGLARCVPKGE